MHVIKLGCLALAFSPNQLNAQILEQDDPVFGVGAITRDTVQMLDFLDLPLSTSRSFVEISGEFGIGGDFAGWRFATAQEVVNLINLAGFQPEVSVGQNQSAAVGEDYLSELRTLVDFTRVSSGPSTGNLLQSIGLVADAGAGPDSRMVVRLDDSLEGLVSDSVVFRARRETSGFSDTGAWLVRPVPAPSTGVAIGLGAITFLRRRRN